jgi:hypothetical protein
MNQQRFKIKDIVIQTIKANDRKAFVEIIKLDSTFVEIQKISVEPYTDYALIRNIKTDEFSTVCCDYLRTLTEQERLLLEMEKRLPEIDGIF